jgi:phosphoglycolate phosphatase
MISLLLFDLDGTLVDSRRDLSTSINSMLRSFGRDPLEDAVLLPFIGFGATHLVRESVRAAGGDIALADAMAVFSREYEAHLLDNTCLYPGVTETLPLLEGIPMAVITNKPCVMAGQVLHGLGIRQHFGLVLGGDALPEMKPSPLPLRHAMRVFNSVPSATLMVGDLPVDIEAARAAGTRCCAALYGFLDAATLLESAPDHTIAAFPDLLAVLAADA